MTIEEITSEISIKEVADNSTNVSNIKDKCTKEENKNTKEIDIKGIGTKEIDIQETDTEIDTKEIFIHITVKSSHQDNTNNHIIEIIEHLWFKVI